MVTSEQYKNGEINLLSDLYNGAITIQLPLTFSRSFREVAVETAKGEATETSRWLNPKHEYVIPPGASAVLEIYQEVPGTDSPECMVILIRNYQARIGHEPGAAVFEILPQTGETERTRQKILHRLSAQNPQITDPLLGEIVYNGNYPSSGV